MGGDSRQRSGFAILSTISNQERRVFSKFHDFHVPRLHHGKPWSSYNFLLSLWIELRFCIHKNVISVTAKKYSWRKRSGSFVIKFNLSFGFCDICPALPATQHALRHKEYYSPRGRAVSTSHIRQSRSWARLKNSRRAKIILERLK